jgi:hypothetical protein
VKVRTAVDLPEPISPVTRPQPRSRTTPKASQAGGEFFLTGGRKEILGRDGFGEG